MMMATFKFRRGLFLMVLVIIAVLAGIFMVMRSCSKSSKPQSVNAYGFTCEMTMKYGDTELSGVLSRPSAGQCSITLTGPETVNGMVFNLEGEDVTVNYMGSKMDIKDVKMQPSNFLLPISKALDIAINTDNLKTSKTGDQIVFSGDLPGESGAEFKIFSDEGGKISEIQIPSSNICIKLNSYK